MSEYYKSLISDEDVVKELLKDSKRREQKLPNQNSRLRPNINFFQRTVKHLVANNNRITKRADTFKEDYLKDGKVRKLKRRIYKSAIGKPSATSYKYERHLILQANISFVKAKDSGDEVMLQQTSPWLSNPSSRVNGEHSCQIVEISSSSDKRDSDSDSSFESEYDLDRRNLQSNSEKKKCSQKNTDMIWISSDDCSSKSDSSDSDVVFVGKLSGTSNKVKTLRNRQKLKLPPYIYID
ncbi:uncharacterized protein [Euwallacea similis]|uniref:uncharacterized protein n=1 Tax=Euwallacea similis TaxID=1736056 RepID=UPI00344CC5C8